MAEIRPPGISARDWAVEQSKSLLRMAGDPDSANELNIVTQIFKGLIDGTDWATYEEGREDTLPKVKELFVQAATLAGSGLGWIITNVYGVNAIGNSFGTIASGAGVAATRLEAGRSVVKAIFEIFDLDGIKEGFANRLPGSHEEENFARFVGMNWQLQMADLIAEMASRWVPRDVAGGVREIGDKVQKILGLEDAQEEIMEPLMEKLIITGLEKRFNRETLPTDLAAGDAVQAYIMGLLTPFQFKQIMDNEGIREDIRPLLLQLRAKNLSESDARDLLERGVWDADALKPFFVSQGFLEADALRKAALVADDRKWKLKKELLTVKESQFVAGVIDEQALRTYLGTMFFSPEEEDIEIEIVKAKASLSKTGKPKQIAGTFNVAPWRVKPGNTAMMSWNIRNADTVTISGIGDVPARGERVITPDISQTYILTATSDTDSERFEAAVQVGDTRELKRPTVTFSAAPGKITMGQPVELKWVTGNADSVSIDGIGPVPEAGAQAVYPFLSTVYTLRASNPQGTTVRQDIVFVSLPDLDLDKERRPAISFSITPTVVKASQPRAELNWSITRADGGTLTFPDGSSRSVDQNGALIVTATESGIYTLKASNLFGETQNQEGLIWQGEEQEPPV